MLTDEQLNAAAEIATGANDAVKKLLFEALQAKPRIKTAEAHRDSWQKEAQRLQAELNLRPDLRLREVARQAAEVLEMVGRAGSLSPGGEERGNSIHCYDLSQQLKKLLNNA